MNYLKNLRARFGYVVKSYVYEDVKFPRGFDLYPCQDTVTKIKLLDQKLSLLYRRTTKQQPGELFVRKTAEASTLPDYNDVAGSIDAILGSVSVNIASLERLFGNDWRVTVRSEKNGTPAEKEVSVHKSTSIHQSSNLPNFFYFTDL